MTEERALCLASRFYLRDNEVCPTPQEVQRMKQLMQAYVDPEQQRQVRLALKDQMSQPDPV